MTLFCVILEKNPFGERREGEVGCGELHFECNNIYNRRLQINVKNKVHQMHNVRLLMDDIDHKDI